jgi:23S rRNA (adenine1618-N6)-methyltransferase
MLGTDIDPWSFSYANKNVQKNDLSSRIRLRLNTIDDVLISPQAFGVEKLDFTMCNPPFYASSEDMAMSSANKADPPSAICTGADVEMICPGGDAGFVLRMVEESIKLGGAVRWYTSMLGKLSSVHQVIDRLKEIGIDNWAVTLLRAGNKTRRWAVGWSFGNKRPSNVSLIVFNDGRHTNSMQHIARGSDVGTRILPHPTAQTIHTIGITRGEAAELLNTTLRSLDLKWSWQPEKWFGCGIASQNVWSRSARRKRKRVEMEQEDEHDPKAEHKTVDHKAHEADVSFKFDIQVNEGDMEVRWRQGKDNILFESFCGMLKRSMRPK